MKNLPALLTLATAAVLLTPENLMAADHLNLDEGLPLRIQDAYPTAYRNREVQGVFHYERTRDDENRLTLEPRVELGIFPNTELTVFAPIYMGNADRTGSGDIGLELLYNFNQEGMWLPAFAVAGEGEIPTGKDSAGFDTTLKFIATKTIGHSGLDRLHLNLAWEHEAGAGDMERDDRFFAILGYSRRIAADWVLVLDFIREQERLRRENSNVFEVGVRWQLTPLTVISLGVGAGIGDESPHARGMLGLQKSF